jgi:hypothetical protein
MLILAGWSCAGLWWLARRVTPLVALAAAGLSLPVLVGVAMNAPEWLRGPAPYPFEWQWAYHPAVALWRLGPALAGAAGVVAALAAVQAIGRRSHQTAYACLAAAILSGIVLQAGIVHLRQGGALAAIAAATEDDSYTSFFTVAATADDAVRLLASYADRLDTLPMHARTHPPGPVLYYRAALDVVAALPAVATTIVGTAARFQVPVKRFEVAADAGHAPVLQAAALLSGLGVALAAMLAAWPVTVIVRTWGVDRVTAISAGCLWTLCPAALFFVPNFDAVVTLLVATAGALGSVSVTSRNPRLGSLWAFGAGLAAGAAFFCSFGALPMLATAGLLVVCLAHRTRVPLLRLGTVGAVVGLGAIVVIGVPAALGFDRPAVLQRSLRLHREHFTLPRSRTLWLRFNLLDFSIFLGWPLLAWAAGLVAFTRRETGRRGWLALGVVAALVLLVDLADVTRGEVGRLWMPFMPLMFAAVGIGAQSRARAADWLLVALLLAAHALLIALHWSA